MSKGLSMLIATLFTLGAAQAAMASAPLPQPRSQGEVTWLSGGIGQSQSRAFERAARQYPLALEFVVQSRHKGWPAEFAANVPVSITDARGHEVFSARADGPFMLLKLPAGRYEVSADIAGTRLARHVVVGKRPQRVVFEKLG